MLHTFGWAARLPQRHNERVPQTALVLYLALHVLPVVPDLPRHCAPKKHPPLCVTVKRAGGPDELGNRAEQHANPIPHAASCGQASMNEARTNSPRGSSLIATSTGGSLRRSSALTTMPKVPWPSEPVCAGRPSAQGPHAAHAVCWGAKDFQRRTCT